MVVEKLLEFLAVSQARHNWANQAATSLTSRAANVPATNGGDAVPRRPSSSLFVPHVRHGTDRALPARIATALYSPLPTSRSGCLEIPG